MQILLVNGDASSGCDSIASAFQQDLPSQHQVTAFTLRNMKLHGCRGCWTCWVKTPGTCVFRDGMDHIYPLIPSADLLVFLTPVQLGFPSSLTKTFQDRCIPMIHPYFSIIDGEFHHRRRYPKYPRIGLLLKGYESLAAPQRDILTEIYRRYCINLHTSLSFVLSADSSVNEVLHEASCS